MVHYLGYRSDVLSLKSSVDMLYRYKSDL
jgi:hypothetical protein